MTDNKKWREFWIEYVPDKSITHYVETKPISPDFYGEWNNIYRTIQYEAYQDLKERADRLVEALEKTNKFIFDEANYEFLKDAQVADDLFADNKQAIKEYRGEK